jgi:hypothetical protein
MGNEMQQHNVFGRNAITRVSGHLVLKQPGEAAGFAKGVLASVVAGVVLRLLGVA